jgi:hypothetical protein
MDTLEGTLSYDNAVTIKRSSSLNIYGRKKLWLLASPKQRLVVLRVMDSEKRTSENIRNKASRFNPHIFYYASPLQLVSI